MASITKLHEQAINKAKHYMGKFQENKETIRVIGHRVGQHLVADGTGVLAALVADAVEQRKPDAPVAEVLVGVGWLGGLVGASFGKDEVGGYFNAAGMSLSSIGSYELARGFMAARRAKAAAAAG